ncbi:unnamed protein product [Phyllotreta striolata]|uniref:DNA polymerase V n=1 Tax=Phyllotreta striolata TaxID=444603 RepID=A0A9N9TVL8_PHYSR|nr:unnamed protein product [Phyllotreta striolata]
METANEENKDNKTIKRTILDQFANLTNIHDKFRLKGSINILTYLSEKESSEKEIELKYILGRIIRGLGSSTNNARSGFFTILVALLNVEEIQIEQIFELVEKHLHTAGSNSKSENADIYTGQILVSGGVIRSNVWLNIGVNHKSTLISNILKACKERSYHTLLGYEFIGQALEKADKKELHKLCTLIKEILTPFENYTLDSLYLMCYLKKNVPNVPKNVIKYPDIFAEKNLKNLCDILTIIPRLATLQHPVYDIIGAEAANSGKLAEFLEHIDACLDIPNRNKLFLVTKLLTVILENLQDRTQIPTVLNKNFIHQTLTYYKSLKGKSDDVEYGKISKTFLDALIDATKENNVESDTKISILKKLLFSPGTFIIEKITHSKVIQNITLNLNVDGVKKLAKVYKNVIEGKEVIDNQYGHRDLWSNNDKLYATHLLIKLLNHKATKDDNQWKVEQLIFIMELSILKENNVQIGVELAASLKPAFFGALDLKLTKLEDLHTILLQIVLHLDSKINPDNLESILRTPISSDNYAIWQKAIETVKKIEKKKKKGGLKTVFLTLFLYLSLLLFNDPKLAMDALNELFVCYKQTRKQRKDSDTLEAVGDEEITEDLTWIEVVTDLFLNFLSQNSSLLRTVVNIVFPHLCEHMTPDTIQQLVSVLDPENENPLSNDNEDDDESDDEDESDDANEEDEAEEEDEEDEDDVENETVNDRLRMALHKALVTNGYKSDEESVDLDEISDTEGKRLDKALGEAFKQYRPNLGKSKKQSKEQMTLTHFRIRVLDLIEIYLNSTPSMILALEIMLPLLKTVEFSLRDEHQTPLLNRLKSCLKHLSNLKKFKDFDGVDDAVLTDLLKSLLDKGTKSAWIMQDMANQIADCCVFVIKCSDLLRANESTPKKVKKRLSNSITGVVVDELDGYFSKRDCVTPILFFKKVVQLSWDGNLGLMPSILKCIFDDNVKVFRKSQAAELATIFYSNHRYINSKPEEIKGALEGIHSEFSDNIVALFKNFCDNTVKNASEKFTCHLFKLLTSMKVCTIVDLKWTEVADVVREYRSSVSLSKDAKLAFNRLCDRLQVSNVVKMKSTLNVFKQTSEEKSNEKDDTKVKKKRNKEKLKLKKETKELRLQSLSEGFRNLDFSSANGVEMEVEDEARKRKHEDADSTETLEGDSSPKVHQNGTQKIRKTKRKKLE